MGLIGKRVRSFPSKFGDAVDVGLKDVVNEREGITREERGKFKSARYTLVWPRAKK